MTRPTDAAVARWEVRHRYWDGAPWGPWESFDTKDERDAHMSRFDGSPWLHETRELALIDRAPAREGGDAGYLFNSDEVRQALEVLRGRGGRTALIAEVLDEMERCLMANRDDEDGQ